MDKANCIEIPSRNQRLEWIDVLRGLAIFFVILGHSIPDQTQFFVYTSPVKMPLFFIISGYLFSIRLDTSVYMKKIFFRLVVPWFLLSLTPFIAKPERLLDEFFMLIQGKRVWFMLTFTVDSIIVYFMVKKIGKLTTILIVSSVLACIGLLLTSINRPNIMMINTILTTQAYIVVAYFCKNRLLNYITLSLNLGILILFVYISLCFFGFQIFHDTIDVHTNHYFNIPFCVILIASGNISLFVIGKNLFNSRYLKPIAFLGQQSLTVYLLSGTFTFLFNPILQKCSDILHLHSIILIKTLGAILCCGMLSVISYYIGKYLPLLNGEYKGYRKQDNLTV